MLIADSVWEQELRVVGQGAIANIVQKERGREEHRLQRLQAAATAIQISLAGSTQSGHLHSWGRDLEFDLTTEQLSEEKERARITAMSMWRRVLASVTNERGVWSPASILQEGRGMSPSTVYWRLDETEDTSRQRIRFVRNDSGSARPEATLEEGVASAEDPTKNVEAGAEWYAQVQQSLGFKLPAVPQMDVVSAVASAEDGADSDADESVADTSSLSVSQLEERTQNDQRMLFADDCTLVHPGHCVPGQLFVLDHEIFFSVDVTSGTYVTPLSTHRCHNTV